METGNVTTNEELQKCMKEKVHEIIITGEFADKHRKVLRTAPIALSVLAVITVLDGRIWAGRPPFVWVHRHEDSYNANESFYAALIVLLLSPVLGIGYKIADYSKGKVGSEKEITLLTSRFDSNLENGAFAPFSRRVNRHVPRDAGASRGTLPG